MFNIIVFINNHVNFGVLKFFWSTVTFKNGTLFKMCWLCDQILICMCVSIILFFILLSLLEIIQPNKKKAFNLEHLQLFNLSLLEHGWSIISGLFAVIWNIEYCSTIIYGYFKPSVNLRKFLKKLFSLDILIEQAFQCILFIYKI